MSARALHVLCVTLALCRVTDLPASNRDEGSSHWQPDEVARFAKQFEQRLADRGARVALVARVGRPPQDLPPGVHYTHVGFAVYSQITTRDGRQVPGYAMYNLYQETGRPDHSELVQDYPVDFFAPVYSLEAGIVIPKPELQRRLLALIADGSFRRLHNPHYSLVANPYRDKYQNCTVFVLDVLMAALYQTTDPARIEVNINAYFKAQPIAIAPVKSMLGSLFRPELALSDQDGPVRTATFESLAAFMRDNGLAQEELTLDGRPAVH